MRKLFFKERNLYYERGRIAFDEFEAGMSYDQMPEVRVIDIADFYVRKDHSNVMEPVVLAYANDPVEIATRKFMIYHIQLPAFRREHPTLEAVKGDAFRTWLYMLDQGYKEEDEMEMIAGMTEGLKNFAERYNISINDPDLLRKYRMITFGEHDIATRISVAEKRGEKRGEKKAHLEDARNFKAEGVDVDIISRVMGLSVQEIEKL